MCRCQILFAQVNCAASVPCVMCMNARTQSNANQFRLCAAFTLENWNECVAFAQITMCIFPSILAWAAAWMWQLHGTIEHAPAPRRSILEKRVTRSLAIFPCRYIATPGQRASVDLIGFSRLSPAHIYQHKKGNIFLVPVSPPSHCISPSIRLFRSPFNAIHLMPVEVIFYHLIRKICKCHFMFIVHMHTTCDTVRCEWMNEWMRRTLSRPHEHRHREHNKSFDQTNDAIGWDRANKCRIDRFICFAVPHASTIDVVIASGSLASGTRDICIHCALFCLNLLNGEKWTRETYLDTRPMSIDAGSKRAEKDHFF